MAALDVEEYLARLRQLVEAAGQESPPQAHRGRLPLTLLEIADYLRRRPRGGEEPILSDLKILCCSARHRQTPWVCDARPEQPFLCPLGLEEPVRRGSGSAV